MECGKLWLQKESKMPKYVDAAAKCLLLPQTCPSPLKPGDTIYLEDRKESVSRQWLSVRFPGKPLTSKVAGQLARKVRAPSR